jgi:hypothetical protein
VFGLVMQNLVNNLFSFHTVSAFSNSNDPDVENVAKKFENCRNWIKATQLNIFGKFQGSEVKAFAVYYTKYILHSQICDLFVIANNQFGFPVLVSMHTCCVPYIVELFGNATGSFFSTFVVY